jgi:hypothetical protein
VRFPDLRTLIDCLHDIVTRRVAIRISRLPKP